MKQEMRFWMKYVSQGIIVRLIFALVALFVIFSIIYFDPADPAIHQLCGG